MTRGLGLVNGAVADQTEAILLAAATFAVLKGITCDSIHFATAAI